MRFRRKCWLFMQMESYPGKTDAQLLLEFSSLSTKHQLADLLQISSAKLDYFAFRFPKKDQYKSFYISKRNGDQRRIDTPASSLKIIQQKLNYIFQLLYTVHPSAHGFVKGRSVVTHAKHHVNKRFVLNVDIENFFPTIHFGRIYGLFQSYPYNCNKKIATYLASLCTYNNCLPQGAPTSPILSNMICYKLDQDLLNLARQNGCYYSRYADDISFSTFQRRMPRAIVIHSKRNGWLPSAKLVEILENNDFKLNLSKINLKKKDNRQEVTGVIVNKKLNAKRKYIRQIRSMIHAWEKYGIENASKEHFAKYDNKQRNSELPDHRTYRNILLGKINYLAMLRGQDDEMVVNFRIRISMIASSDYHYNNPMTRRNDLRSPIWVIEAWHKGHLVSQGTGFSLRDIGIITCHHVIHPSSIDVKEEVQVFAWKIFNRETRIKLDILKSSEELDIALLSSPKDIIIDELERPDTYPELEPGFRISLIGFPMVTGNSQKHASIENGTVSYERRLYGRREIVINCDIYDGQSGSPLLNSKNLVIGIATMGSTRNSDRNKGSYENTVVHISEIENLLSV